MTELDFYVNRVYNTPGEGVQFTHTVVTELRTDNNYNDITLDKYLEKYGVPDEEIGRAIEELEALPYRAQSTTVEGRHGTIIINQEG